MADPERNGCHLVAPDEAHGEDSGMGGLSCCVLVGSDDRIAESAWIKPRRRLGTDCGALVLWQG